MLGTVTVDGWLPIVAIYGLILHPASVNNIYFIGLISHKWAQLINVNT